MGAQDVKVDLHIHTSASDGCWSPEEVIGAVQTAEINLFAIADHETTANVSAVAALADQAGLHFIPAVEISCSIGAANQGQSLHILGYGIDIAEPTLQAILARNHTLLESLDEQSIRKLIAAGYDINWEEYVAYDNDRSRGGWRALNFMVDHGICTGMKDFFTRLFIGDLALEYPVFASIKEATTAIHRAGGLAVWAHPGHHIKLETCTSAEKAILSSDAGEEDSDRLPRLIDRMVMLGLDGVECYSHYHGKQITQALLEVCRGRKLIISSGSDCHGGCAGREIGIPKTYLSDLALGPLKGTFTF